MSSAPKASCGGESSSSLLDLNTSPLPSEVETFDHTIFFAESAEESEDVPEEASYVAKFKAKIEMRRVPGFENHSGMSNYSVHSHSSPLAGSGLMTRQFFPLKEASSESAVTRPYHPFSFQSRNSEAPLNDPKLCNGDFLSSSIPLQTARKSRRGPRSKSSEFKGVTFYKRTGRWESHIWDCGKQVYLGGFDTAQAAARAYDRAALRFRGPDAEINFHILDYEEDLKQISHLNKEEVIQILRRQRTGLSGARRRYTGVTLHNRGRWEVQFLEKRVYDRAAVRCHGSETETNFDPRIYASVNRVESALDLKIGGASCSSSTMNIGAPPDDRLQGACKSFDSNINNKDLERTGKKCQDDSSVMLLQRHSRNHERSLPVEASLGTTRCSHGIQGKGTSYHDEKPILRHNGEQNFCTFSPVCTNLHLPSQFARKISS